MFKIEVKGNRLYTLQRDYLTSGSVEIQTVDFIFSPEWDSFTKEVIFKLNNGETNPKGIVPDDSGYYIIPWELLNKPGFELLVGVYGTKGTQVMTTEYISLGRVHKGTNDSAEDPDPPPTPDIYRQLINLTGEALEEVKKLRQDAENGEFDGPPGPQGPPGIPGTDGKDGEDGINGTDGKDGTDGFSPNVTVEDIEGGHRVTITDINGVKTFDVMDGETKIDESIKNGSILYYSLGSTPKEGDTKWFNKTSIVGKIPGMGMPFLGILYDLSKDPDEIYLCQLVAIKEDSDDMMQFSILKIYNYPSSRVADLSNGTFIVSPSSDVPNVGDNYNYDRTRIVGLTPNVDDACRGLLYTNSGAYLCSFAVRNITSSGTVNAITTSVRNLGGSNDNGLPVGTIVMWSGTASNIPDKWHICDGTSGTPDLRGRFVLGASSKYTTGTFGGEEETLLTIDNMPAHNHGLPIITGNTSGNARRGVDAEWITAAYTRASTEISGGDVPHNNMPPYYTLVYIMKMEA